jgi:hypothetical protein
MLLVRFQFAAFFSEPIQRPDRIGQRLNDHCGDLFDQPPMIIPLPDNVPSDIPSATYNDSKGKYQCTIAKSRLDFYINGSELEYSYDVLLNEYNSVVRPYLIGLISFESINRVGIVGQYFEENVDPYSVITKRYYRQRPFKELTDIGVRYGKKETHKDYVANTVVSVNSAFLNKQNNPVGTLGVFTQIDVNTDTVEKGVSTINVNVIIEKLLKGFSVSEIRGYSK